jgi:hypothetical protein
MRAGVKEQVSYFVSQYVSEECLCIGEVRVAGHGFLDARQKDCATIALAEGRQGDA